MKTKIFNYDNLTESEIDDHIIRVKAIMLNSNKEILFATSFGTIQFPGGHLEEKETLNEALIREVKEETGITLKGDYQPFYAIKYFLKDYPIKGHNRSIEIYYFQINTDEHYNLKKLYLDDQERSGNFNLQYIALKKVNKYLKQNLKNNQINKIVNREIKLALKHMRRKNGY